MIGAGHQIEKVSDVASTNFDEAASKKAKE
jgi:hypothetical protein